MKKIKNLNNFSGIAIALLSFALFSISCEEEPFDSLPGVGGIKDETPPKANFVATNSEFSNLDTDLIVFQFINASESSINYKWKLPEGASIYTDNLSAEEKEARLKFNEEQNTIGFTVNDNLLTDAENLMLSEIENIDERNSKKAEFLDEVTKTTWDEFGKNIFIKFDEYKPYNVELMSIDGNGEANRAVQELVIIKTKPTPIIKNPDFEDDGGSFVDWKNTSLGKQGGTSGDSNTGEKSLKFDAGDQRVAYQEIKVIPDTKYVFDFVYSIKAVGDSELEVRILSLSETITKSNIEAQTLDKKVFGVDATTEGSKNFNPGSLGFSSKENTNVAIYIKAIGGANGTDGFPKNGGQDVRVDTASIRVIE